MGQLWAHSLGNTPGNPYTSSGPFDTTLWPTTVYWTDDLYYNHLSTFVVYYSLYSGNVGEVALNNGQTGFATEFAGHDGDIGSIPEPAALSLLAFAASAMLRRRK